MIVKLSQTMAKQPTTVRCQQNKNTMSQHTNEDLKTTLLFKKFNISVGHKGSTASPHKPAIQIFLKAV